MQSILDVVDQEARKAGATEVHQVRVRIGQLSGVVPESLEYAFEVLRRGTLAEHAPLVLEFIPAVCWCAQCRREFAVTELLCQCPECGTVSLDLRCGRELELASLEIS